MNMDELNRMEKIVDYFLENKQRMIELSSLEGQDVLQLASLLAKDAEDHDLKNKGYNLLYSCCYFLRLDIKELWNIYWILTRAVFIDNRVKLNGNLDELYQMIFHKVVEVVQMPFEKIDDKKSNLIVMITSQFLGINHAPTRRILDYAYTFITFLNKKVVIINDSGLNFYPFSFLEQEFIPNFLHEYDNMESISYRGLGIPFLQISNYMPDIDDMKKILSIIYELKPALVYNIGGSSLLADLCGTFTKTVAFSCSTQIPISMSKFLLVGRKINEADKDRIERLEPYQQIVETVVNYQLPERHSCFYERSQFGLKESDFVIGLVGNRLDTEIDASFIKVIRQILNIFDVHFLIIGTISNKRRITENVERAERIHFAGELQEADQVMGLIDVYCNPMRNGGGRSSFEALAHGIPVITMKYGDVYYTCGEVFSVNDKGEYVRSVEKYITDSEYMIRMREAAKERAGYLSDLVTAQGDILKKIL